MGFLLSLLGLAQSCFLVLPQAALAESNNAPEQFTMPNGLKVLILEDHSFPVVTSMVWYHSGSRNETLGSTGVSHLVEHLLFRRVGNMRPGELSAQIARAGGQFNGYTSDDFTSFFEVLPPSRLEMGLQIEADRMRSANFTDKDIQEEVLNLNKEFEREARDPVASLGREIRAAAYQQHPYHNPTMGWQGDVEHINAAQAKTFYEHFFRPDNATLVVVGDIKSATANALIKKHFGTIPKPAVKHQPITCVEPQQKGERSVSLKSSGKQDILEVAYHAPAIHEPDAPALAVMEKLLNAAYNGRLRTRLVEPRVCSMAYAKFEAKKDPGLFEITCLASAGNGEQKVLETLDGALNQLRDQPIADAELKRARNQAEFEYLSERDGPYRAGFHLGYFDCLSSWQNAYSWTERIRAVSVADIQKAAKRYFNPDNRVIGWVSAANAPKAPKEKPDAPDSTPADPKKQPHSKPGDHVRMTGYKTDDYALGPERPGTAGGSPALANKLMLSEAGGETPAPPSQDSKPNASVETPQLESKPAEQAPKPTEQPAKPTEQPAKPAEQSVKPAEQSVKPAEQPAKPAEQAPKPSPPARQPSSSSAQPGTAKPHPESALHSIHQKVLSNGLTLVVLESHLSPIVQVRGAIKAGDAFDPAGKKGLSAVVAAALNHGSTKHNKSQMQNVQEDLGLPPHAMLKFESGPETINFETECLSRDLGSQLSLLGEILSSPGYQDIDVDKSKLDVIAMMRRQQDSLDGRVNRALLRSLIAPSSPYCPADPLDKLKSINKFEPADLKDFHEHFINPGASYLVVVGDVSLNQAAQLAEKYLSGWTGKSGRQFPAVAVNSKRILRTSIPLKDKSNPLLCFGQLMPLSRNHQDYVQLLVADCALTNHPIFSRLGQLANTEPQMAAAVGSEALESEVESLSNSIEWSLTLSPEPNAVPYVLRTVQNELRNFTRNGVTQQDVTEVKRYLLGAIPVRSMSSIDAASTTILESVLQGGDPDYAGQILSQLKLVTAESVNKLIHSTFKPEQAALVVAGSSQSITAVRTQTEKALPAARTQSEKSVPAARTQAEKVPAANSPPAQPVKPGVK
jgi:zinc protease